MRTITATQARVYAGLRPAYAVRVWTKDGAGNSVNLQSFLGGDWVLSVEWGEDVDSAGMDATVTLARARNRISLAPGRSLGMANAAGTLLAPYREIWIDAAIFPTTRAVAASDWVEVFRGNIQAVDWGDPASITVSAIGLQGLLQSAWITTVDVYGSSGGTAVETVIQDVLDDWASHTTLYTPTSPGWMITPFQSQIQSVWDELLQLADSLGWSLRYLYNDGASEWRLTLYEPDRHASATPYEVAPTRWLAINKAEDSLDNVRNVVAITYADSNNLDATGQGTPATYTATDAASVTAYGQRWMGITLDATSLIDTSAEATTMGDAILADVAYPKTAWELVIPYFHAVELGDVLTLPADGIWLDTDQTVTVVGYRHTLGDELRTTIQCRAAGAVSHHSSWLERAAQRGIAALQQTSAPMDPNDWPPLITEANGGIYAMPDTNASLRKGGFQIEAHAGPVGFTPDLTAGSTTVIGRAKTAALHLPSDTTRLPIGEPRDLVIYYLNDRGVRSTEYRRTKRTVRPGLAWINPDARIAGSFPGSTFTTVTRGTEFPPDGWNMGVGTWNTNAVQDDGGTLVGPLTGTYALTLTTGDEVELDSDVVPVTAGRCYVSQAAVYSNSTTAGHVVTLVVQYYDDSELSTLVGQDYITADVASVANEWITFRRVHSPPAGAKYARVKAYKASGVYSFAIDRVLLEEDQERDDEAARISLSDDFPGADDSGQIGSLPWTLYHETSVGPDAGPATVSKLAPSGWTRVGIVRLETADPSSYPSVAYNFAVGCNAQPFGAGIPPLGTSMSWTVAMAVFPTNVRAWCGLWENEAQSVGINGEGTSFYQRGIGFIAQSGGWWGVVRVVVAGAHVNREVDLSSAANTDWYRLSWRIIGTSIAQTVQFFVNDAPVGTAVDVSDLGDANLFPMFGLIATSTDIPGINVDKMTLYTLGTR